MPGSCAGMGGFNPPTPPPSFRTLHASSIYRCIPWVLGPKDVSTKSDIMHRPITSSADTAVDVHVVVAVVAQLQYVCL